MVYIQYIHPQKIIASKCTYWSR